jgi:hypothetical protein
LHAVNIPGGVRPSYSIYQFAVRFARPAQSTPNANRLLRRRI